MKMVFISALCFIQFSIFFVLDDPDSDQQSTSETTSPGLKSIVASIEQSNSVTAIAATLENVFGRSSQNQASKATKRTVVKRSAGQIMTEQDVIDQIDQKRQETEKRKTSRKSNHKQQ